MKRFQKIFSAALAAGLSLLWQADGYGISPVCDLTKVIRPLTSPAAMRSARRSAAAVDGTSLVCGQNALCGELPGSFAGVYGQVGLLYYDTDLKKNLFVPVYAMKAVNADGQYKVPKWDGNIFWLRVSANPSAPPRVLQPWFIEYDSGGGTIVVSYSLCKQKGRDYSAYEDGAALCELYLTVNKDKLVTDYTLDVYDENYNLAQEGAKLNIGDMIDTLSWAEDDDTPGWVVAGLSLENSTAVEKEPEFIYAGYVPGREFPCSECKDKIDLAESNLYFRLEGWENAEDQEPDWSPKQALGKLKDSVDTCSQYPHQTLAAPGLGDVMEGLQLISNSAPQHFCFRDVNGNGKFDAAEVVWMLRSAGGVK